jgi:hypothetical protein
MKVKELTAEMKKAMSQISARRAGEIQCGKRVALRSMRSPQ